MLMSIVFIAFRILEILTLIPAMGMLAWFVDMYTDANQVPPAFYLVLFIVSIVALVWALVTLFSSRHTGGILIAVVDVLLIGALIAGVWYMRAVEDYDCTSVTRDANWAVGVDGVASVSGPDWDLNTNKACAMQKASWVFGIMNCVFFAVTAIAAYSVGKHYQSRRRTKHRRRSRSSSYSRRRVYV